MASICLFGLGQRTPGGNQAQQQGQNGQSQQTYSHARENDAAACAIEGHDDPLRLRDANGAVKPFRPYGLNDAQPFFGA